MTMLKPIKPKRFSDQVFEQLRDLIYRGNFKPGEQLMPERELARALGVSRPTVREAINKLVSLGFVEQRQGQGTFVRSPSDDAARNPFAAAIDGHDARLADLLEVRLGLECNAVALAARRATEEDILELDKCLRRFEEAVEDGGLGTDANVSFHMTIAFATKNVVQVQIMRNLYDLLFYGIKEDLAQLYSEAGYMEKITRQHGDICDAIRRHDPDAAFQAMKQHITCVLDFMQTPRTGGTIHRLLERRTRQTR